MSNGMEPGSGTQPWERARLSFFFTAVWPAATAGGISSPRCRSHHRVILIDSRGHGRSTLGTKPLSYELMEGDVLAVMDAMGIAEGGHRRVE